MRRRLVVLFIAVTTMVALAFLVPLALLVREVARDDARRDARGDALALAPVLALGAPASSVEAATLATPTGRAGRLTVYLADGAVVGQDVAATQRVALARSEGRADSGAVAGGEEVVVPVVTAAGAPAVVRAFIPSSQLEAGVRRSWATLAGVGLALVLIAVLVADRLARTIVRPVEELAGAADRLGSGDLGVRVDESAPDELGGVAHAFNTLVGRVEELLAAEREMVADLAHRLRTPLTALRLDAEGISEPDTARRVSADIAQLDRTVDRIIGDARRPTRGTLVARCDPGQVVEDRVAFWSVLAEDQGRALRLRRDEGAVPALALDPGELAAALDVLIDNVFAHTPEGTPFVVALAADDRAVEVAVEDDGPGLGAPSVVSRGRSGGGSTGLGLDIARQAARAAGGELVVGASSAGGARVALRLPVRAGAPATAGRGPGR